jgi:hypothetical protein
LREKLGKISVEGLAGIFGALDLTQPLAQSVLVAGQCSADLLFESLSQRHQSITTCGDLPRRQVTGRTHGSRTAD